MLKHVCQIKQWAERSSCPALPVYSRIGHPRPSLRRTITHTISGLRKFWAHFCTANLACRIRGLWVPWVPRFMFFFDRTVLNLSSDCENQWKMRAMVGHTESSVVISKHGLHEDYGRYWSCEEFVQFFFKIFDGYITGSLGPAGSQTRKKEIFNTRNVLFQAPK